MSQAKGTSAPNQEELKFLGKSQTVHHLSKLLSEAQKFVILVSPYLSIEKLRDLERNIQSALKRKVSVLLIIRSRDAHTSGPSPSGQQRLQELASQGLRLYEVADLHAKLYVSERHALVTSLNLLESSFNNSIEIGMWVPAQRPEYAQLITFIQREVDPHRRPYRPQPGDVPPAAPSVKLPEPTSRKRQPSRRKAETGHCIRCGDELRLNGARPYCADDYAVWAEYSNPNYRDNFCHGCGDDHPATMNKPFCRDCFEQYEGSLF